MTQAEQHGLLHTWEDGTEPGWWLDLDDDIWFDVDVIPRPHIKLIDMHFTHEIHMATSYDSVTCGTRFVCACVNSEEGNMT